MENKHVINLNDVQWEFPKKGVSQKVFTNGKERLKLLRIDENFRSYKWCFKSHIGYVLEGEMIIEFNGILKNYKKGDVLMVEEGIDNMHCTFIRKGQFVELLLFEKV